MYRANWDDVFLMFVVGTIDRLSDHRRPTRELAPILPFGRRSLRASQLAVSFFWATIKKGPENRASLSSAAEGF